MGHYRGLGRPVGTNLLVVYYMAKGENVRLISAPGTATRDRERKTRL